MKRVKRVRFRANPARVTKRARREAGALVRRYGGKGRAREVAGGMIGAASSRKQREHFIGVRKALNPAKRRRRAQEQLNSLLRLGVPWETIKRREPELYAAAIGTSRARKAQNPRQVARWYIGTREDGSREIKKVVSAVTQPWISAVGPYMSKRDALDVQRRAMIQSEFIRPAKSANPKRRKRSHMPITPEDRGILRAMTREHGKRAVAKAAMRTNPAPMFPMYVRKGNSAPWAMVAVFNKLPNARTVGNLLRLRGYHVRVTDGKA